MCGIVGAVAKRNIGEILLEGLKRLEYRGYDSAGIALIDRCEIKRLRTIGKVKTLCSIFEYNPLIGNVGIAHTRWATHGKVTEENAHPHQSGDTIALVHNGIIENYESLREQLIQKNYQFYTETDTETIAHLIHLELFKTQNFIKAVKNACKQLQGAFALGIIYKNEPDHIIAVRCGSPLVIGLGIDENFIASDNLALLPVTQKFIFLEDGDIADVQYNQITIFDKDRQLVSRETYISQTKQDNIDKIGFRHFMQKEIAEQPEVLQMTLEHYIDAKQGFSELFDKNARTLLDKTRHIQITACGTSYHAGLVARYWLEEIANIPCQVEVASEFRYRKAAILPNTLFIVISQSGETADVLAALRQAKESKYIGSIAICNVKESSLVRESDMAFLTQAGREIGVASTKTFTTQLLVLLMLTLRLARYNLPAKQEIISLLKSLPQKAAMTLQLDDTIKKLASIFATKQHTLFLGRGVHYPIAMEGALKLKELSYIHAEAYPAGELKHGPLALVDKEMPIIAIAPNDNLLGKLRSNLKEVQARGGQLVVFSDKILESDDDCDMINVKMPKVNNLIAPIIYTIPLQLLAYHVALIKGTDVDQPRNLAKSVTVE